MPSMSSEVLRSRKDLITLWYSYQGRGYGTVAYEDEQHVATWYAAVVHIKKSVYFRQLDVPKSTQLTPFNRFFFDVQRRPVLETA